MTNIPNRVKPGVHDYDYYRQPQPLRVPSSLMPPPAHGNKRAVLCGISYGGELKTSLNDVQWMKYFLTNNCGFHDESILLLTDEQLGREPLRIPTKYNIQMALRWLVEGVQPGDSLVFHFSGHGSREVDLNKDEVDGYDEALKPIDYESEGEIIDDEINATIVRPLPRGAKLHALVDTSFSGNVLDFPFMCKMNRQGQYGWEVCIRKNRQAGYKGSKGGLAICISACEDEVNKADTLALSSMPNAGSLTSGFIQSVQSEPGVTYGRLLAAMRSKIRGPG